MTLVERWGRSVSHDESYRSRTALVTRRAALQLGAGAGAAAIAAPYLAPVGGGRACFDLGDAQPVLAPDPELAGAADRSHARGGARTKACASRARSTTRRSTKIIVHHTGTPNDITDYAGLCRGILANETAGEYIDIAYNWLIDPDGRIYEGRWAQDYPPGIAHTGERDGANVRGGARDLPQLAHDRHRVDGQLRHRSDPPPAMIDSLVSLARVEVRALGARPARTAARTTRRTAPIENLFNICGHRDTSATACPGMHVEPMLPTIRTRVAGRMFGGGYWIATSVGRGAAVRRCAAHGDVSLPATIAGIAGPSRRRRLLARAHPMARCTRSAPRTTTAGCTGSGLRADRRHGVDAVAATATGSSPATAASSRSATPGSTARPAGCASTRRCSGWRRPDGQGLLAVRARRRRLLVRRRRVPRVDRRHAARPARRVDGAPAQGRWLLAGRRRRRRLRVRQGATSAARRAAIRPSRRASGCCRRRPAGATCCCARTGRSGRSATRRTSAAPTGCSTRTPIGIAGRLKPF